MLKGGRQLVIFAVIAVVFMFLQNGVGGLVAYAAGLDPLVGVLGGSVSMAGGPGTAAAWAPVFQKEYGVASASEIGIAFATVGMVLGGVLGGQLGGTGVRAVHWTEVRPKKRVDPKTPRAAVELGLTDERCNVRLFIDEKGSVYDVKTEACPTIYKDSAVSAAWKWKFYPYKIEGKAQKAQFVLTFRFVLK